MISIDLNQIGSISVNKEWNFSDDTELSMHTIHAYPAKFPAFIASKAFEYAQKEGVAVESVADIFCGCGTVALEAKLHEKNFWGCDINPVATLIAKTKSESYEISVLKSVYGKIILECENMVASNDLYARCNNRLRYWFNEDSFNVLYQLKSAIYNATSRGKYRDAFLCLFSSILKASSKWLTKSIKPQVDPSKKEIDVLSVFSKQYQKFIRSVEQIEEFTLKASNIEIKNRNFLKIRSLPEVDLIISSPPYVTSYEYADLHQLSTLWLNYVEDYRDVRKGSIGSVYNSEKFQLQLDELNAVGRDIVHNLLDGREATAKVRSVARYYLDMQKAISLCYSMLNVKGMVFFVVGDTEYKGIKIKNSEHLIQCLLNEGFTDIKAAKRRISNKILTPYRDNIGRFSSDKSQRTIYHEEFIISGRKYKE